METPRTKRDLENGKARYELIDKDGNSAGIFDRVFDAGWYAVSRWPDQEQDEDRTGKGWDVQCVGCE